MEHSNIIIYQTENGQTKIETRLEDETVWLTQAQLAELFQKSRVTITEHIGNIFKEGELEENSVCRNFRHTTQHGAFEGKIHEYEKFKEQAKNDLSQAEIHFVKHLETTTKQLNFKKSKK